MLKSGRKWPKCPAEPNYDSVKFQINRRRGSLFKPVWFYEGGENPTLNFRAVGVFGYPQEANTK